MFRKEYKLTIIDDYGSKNTSYEPSVAIVIDPNILFFSLQTNEPSDRLFHINPILHAWLSNIKSQSSNTKINIYLLAYNNQPRLTVHTNYETVYTPITSEFISKLLSKESHEQLLAIWDHDLHIVNHLESSSTGLAYFSDNKIPLQDELLVITNNTELVEYFCRKQIAVVHMEPFHKPQMIESFDLPETSDKLEIYSDFDRTLFDIDNFAAVSTFNPELSHTHIITKKHTLAFLEELRKYPTYLITQRTDIFEQHHAPCKRVNNIITHINEQHALNIQMDKTSFLNAHSQIEKKSVYEKKIEVIYHRLLDRAPWERPSQILLLDDDIEEITKCTQVKDTFKAIGVKLSYALILHPIYFSQGYLSYIKAKDIDLFNKIDHLLNQEMIKLTQAYTRVLNKVLPDLEIATKTIEDDFVLLECEEKKEEKNESCVIS